MTTFFSSDTHFNHRNIGKYCPERVQRWPGMLRSDGTFDLDVMNEGLIERWNAVVGPSDTVYHLGDLSFAGPDTTIKLLARLNGTIHFISGNHDRVVHDNAPVAAMFASVRGMREIKHGKQGLFLAHFPHLIWNRSHHGVIHLHGHCHGTLPQYGGKRLDIGVDSHHITGQPEHRPFAIEEILEVASKIDIVVLDHHTPSTTNGTHEGP